ncbi:hypothetical protein [Chryseobacterium indologenes]|uniref:Uncharacterized protein n=1 Tax=Chryseobacterium indologenes TaxID=253 RepID=A0A0N0ZZI9_CHRID|nr:hypothetical protein [Chryseobacterium indologenes]KPE52487.1 hypothetical protein AOB46_00180 [Chryseobacterium indologenes]
MYKILRYESNRKFRVICIGNTDAVVLTPLEERLHAGGYSAFPSAALDFTDESIDFLKLLVKDPVTTAVTNHQDNNF